jgi:hypothetical protein
MKKLILVLPVAGAILLAWSALPGSNAGALAPCLARPTTGEESQFFSMVQSWRSANGLGGALTLSGPLNAAAVGYAQFLASHPGYQGHYADGTSNYAWVSRAIQCGYPSASGIQPGDYYPPTAGIAGGEGVAAFEVAQAAQATAQGALNQMTAEPGGGLHIPPNVGAPVACAGVGKASVGGKTAWVVLLFATTTGTCPQAVAAGVPTASASPSPSVSPTSAFPTITPTPSPIPTSTPVPTMTPIPTPSIWHIYAPFAGRD